MRTCIWMLLATLVTAISSPVLAGAYNAIELRNPSGYQRWDTASTGINDRGEIIGGLAVDATGMTHTLYWSDCASSPTDLTPSTMLAQVGGLNYYGELAGTLAGVGGRSATAVRMTLAGVSTIMQDLSGTLGSCAYAINNNGMVVGTAIGEVNGSTENWAVMWDANGTPTRITASSSGPCEARAVNGHGMVVGITSAASEHAAFVWDSASDYYRELPLLAGTNSAEAFGINDSGYVVGRSGDHAVMWTPGGDVIDLSKSYGLAAAYGTNSRGQIVGVLDSQAVIWNTADEFTILGASGSSASSINDLGQIVGSVSLSAGNSRAVLWQPVPEPSSLVALFCGLVGVSAVARRRASSRQPRRWPP